MLIQKARAAQKALEALSQEEVDQIVRELAYIVHKNAEELAILAVEETGMGNVQDKIAKNKSKAELIWEDLKDEKSVGLIKVDVSSGIWEIAEPMGTVLAITPCTNPSVTPMANAMFCIKTRNCCIIAPHPRAQKTTERTVELMIEAGEKVGLPKDAIQVISNSNKELTQALMSEVDANIATGGPGVVRAAYSSGRPSFGVGAGDVPALIHESADIQQAAKDIVRSKTFDNGLICASESAIITTIDISDTVWDALKKEGAYITSTPEALRLRYAIFDEDGHLVPEVIGQSVYKVADMAGISLPEGIQILVTPTEGVGEGFVFSHEKLCPVLGLYIMRNFDECIDLAKRILDFQGTGHTASIHCNDEEVAKEYAMRVRASRILVNQPAALSSGGSRENALTPSTTLGCGTWGGSSTTENITAAHLLNIKRLVFKHATARDTSKVFEP